MASPVTASVMADLLDPRFKEVSNGAFKEHKDMIPIIFDVRSDDRDTVRVTGLTPFGDPVELDGTLVYDGPDQAYDATATHKEIAQGIQIGRTLYDDSQFDVIDDMFAGVGRNFFRKRQKDGARIFNEAFNVDTEFYSHSEGVALCSNSHTTTRANVSTASGFDNLIVGEFNPANLSAAITQFRYFRDLAGEPIDEPPTELWGAIDMDDRFDEVLQTMHGLDTNEGNVNVHEGRLTKYVWVRITDTNDWFLCNSAERKRALRWYERIPFETAKMESFDQFNVKGRGYARYSFLYRYWQWILGAQVT